LYCARVTCRLEVNLESIHSIVSMQVANKAYKTTDNDIKAYADIKHRKADMQTDRELHRENCTKEHRRIGAQSTLGGTTFLPEKYV